jgi:hypothetical protein
LIYLGFCIRFGSLGIDLFKFCIRLKSSRFDFSAFVVSSKRTVGEPSSGGQWDLDEEMSAGPLPAVSKLIRALIAQFTLFTMSLTDGDLNSHRAMLKVWLN